MKRAKLGSVKQWVGREPWYLPKGRKNVPKGRRAGVINELRARHAKQRGLTS